MNNVLDIKNNCTGCGVCSIICPLSCIDIKCSEQGFYRPVVNENECIKCGLCKRVCYKFFYNNFDNSIEKSKAYLSYSKNEDNRFNSSSGGVGRELCYYAINNNYEVCGVEYDYSKDIAKHIIVKESSDISKISKSKYLPSYTEAAFKNLDKDKKYLVVGSPCQIYGLRKYMEINGLNNLILVDFFCHGAPSLNLWKKYLEMIKDKYDIDNITQIDFRDKSNGWHNFSMKIQGDKNVYKKSHKEDRFFNFFLMNLDLDESCINCKLRFNQIYSDVRLGDFWGPKCQQDESGVSIVLSNTDLGGKVLRSINNIVLEEITFEELKVSQYIEKLNQPKESVEVKRQLQGRKKLQTIYNEVIIPMKIKRKITNKVNSIKRISKK